MRILYTVHGRGRGHASRAVPVVAALRAAGHAVVLRGGGQADDLLSADPSYQHVDLVLPGLSGARTLLRRLATEGAAFRRHSPDMIITDGDLPSVVTARRLGIPSLSLGHDGIFTHCQLPSSIPRTWVAGERINAVGVYLANRVVAVNFLPLRTTKPNVVLARPELDPALTEPSARAGHILCYFRDRNGHEVLKALSALGARVLVFGQNSGGLAGIESKPFSRSEFVEALQSCRAVVASAGSNLLAECVALGRPVLALHLKRDREQAINARLLDSSGLGRAASFENVSRHDVRAFLDQLAQYQRIDLATLLPGTVESVLRVVDELTSSPLF